MRATRCTNSVAEPTPDDNRVRQALMADTEHRRPSPEQLLEQVEDEQRRAAQGRLKVFLGYASGVGKSFRMFDEGRRRRSRGEDVVVAATQSTEPAEVEQLLSGLEVIPARVVD